MVSRRLGRVGVAVALTGVFIAPTATASTSQVAKVETRVTVTQARSDPCWTVNFTGDAKNGVGGTLYTFWQNTTVCHASSQVTSVRVENVGGETSTPGWRYESEKTTTTTMNAGWEGRGAAAFHFVLGAGGIDIQHPVECLQGRLNADGVHHARLTTCNLA